MRRPDTRLTLALSAVAGSFTTPCHATDTPAFAYVPGAYAYAGSPGPGGAACGGYTFGWGFIPNQNITVTALAVADAFNPGFFLDHTIHLWDLQTRQLLRSVLAPAGPEPGGSLGANEYRYYPVAPVELQAGRTYVIGVGFPAVTNPNASMDYYYSTNLATSRTFDPRITWLDGRLSGCLNTLPGSLGSGSGGQQPLGSCNFLIAPPPPPPCLGDLNADGAVNTLDLTIILSAFGSVVTPPGAGADLNASGTVDTADLVIFLGRFGATCP